MTFSDAVLKQVIAAYLPTKTEAEGIAAMRAVLEGHLAEQDRKRGIYQAAEDLWEEIGGLCICQQQDTPHWCEDCQRKLGIVRNALRRAASDGSPR